MVRKGVAERSLQRSLGVQGAKHLLWYGFIEEMATSRKYLVMLDEQKWASIVERRSSFKYALKFSQNSHYHQAIMRSICQGFPFWSFTHITMCFP